MMLNQFEGQPNGEAKVALDADGTPITILDFFGLEGDVLGNKWACIPSSSHPVEPMGALAARASAQRGSAARRG